MVFEMLEVSREGPFCSRKIAAPPMNPAGPELVRDLVSLMQRTEADDAIQGPVDHTLSSV